MLLSSESDEESASEGSPAFGCGPREKSETRLASWNSSSHAAASIFRRLVEGLLVDDTSFRRQNKSGVVSVILLVLNQHGNE